MTQRKGITLIEVLLTLTIVSILSVAAMRVTIRISRADRVEQARDSISELTPRLNELLRMDAVHATGYRTSREGFELQSLSALDYDSLRLSHLPATVRYKVRSIGGVSWLVRTQSGRGGVLNELVCPGVSRVALDSPDRDDKSDEFKPTPQTMTIVVTLVDRPDCPLAFTCDTE